MVGPGEWFVEQFGDPRCAARSGARWSLMGMVRPGPLEVFASPFVSVSLFSRVLQVGMNSDRPSVRSRTVRVGTTRSEQSGRGCCASVAVPTNPSGAHREIAADRDVLPSPFRIPIIARQEVLQRQLKSRRMAESSMRHQTSCGTGFVGFVGATPGQISVYSEAFLSVVTVQLSGHQQVQHR